MTELSPQKRAEVQARIAELIGPPPKVRPKVVVSEGRSIRDAVVGPLSPSDPNNRSTPDGFVRVERRPPGWCTVNLEAADRMWRAERAQALADEAHRAQLDPYNCGLWGPIR